MFEDIRLDHAGSVLISGLSSTRDDHVMRAFADALEKQGIKVLSSTCLLPDLLAPAGCWTKRPPTPEEQADISLAYRIAKEIGKLDIGQCVVAAKGSIMAVEAIEGTDAAIRRAGTLCPGGAVVVKVKKPGQDPRFDLPAAGPGTIRVMAEAGASALALEAGESVIFDREEMVKLADEYGIAIVGITHEAG
jgi:DUF1009 family protein